MIDLDVHAAAIAAGDADAFGAFLRHAEHPLRVSLTPFAASVDTEAILQEALLRLWQVAPRWVSDGRPNGLLRLASRIARNAALDAVRRRHEVGYVEPPEVEVAPAEPDPLLRIRIAACRDALPAKPAQALNARLESDGRPDRELAASLRMELNTFLQNFGRARRLLADCLRKAGVDAALLGGLG